MWTSPPAFLAVMREAEVRVAEIAARALKLKDVVEKLRSRLVVVKAGDPQREYRVAAVDSTYTTPYLELVGGRLAVVVAGYVLHPPQASPHYTVSRILFDEASDNFDAKVEYTSKILERKIALNLLRMKERGKIDIDLVVLDGPILPHPLPYRLPRASGTVGTLSRVALDLVEKARDTRTSLVGVVKRSYTMFLKAIYGGETSFNDKTILSLLLKPREYTVLGTYKTLIPKLIVSRGSRGGRPEELERFREVLKVSEHVGNITVVFYKSRNPVAYSQATKAEILDFGGYGVDSIVSHLDVNTSMNGVPHYIDQVDEYVRFESRALELIQQILEARLTQLMGVEGYTISGYTNPQKRRAHRSRR